MPGPGLHPGSPVPESRSPVSGSGATCQGLGHTLSGADPRSCEGGGQAMVASEGSWITPGASPCSSSLPRAACRQGHPPGLTQTEGLGFPLQGSRACGRGLGRRLGRGWVLAPLAPPSSRSQDLLFTCLLRATPLRWGEKPAPSVLSLQSILSPAGGWLAGPRARLRAQMCRQEGRRTWVGRGQRRSPGAWK